MCSLFVDSGLITERKYIITALTKGSDGRTFTSLEGSSLKVNHEMQHTQTDGTRRGKNP